jgi:hypothetical protein
MGFKNTLTIIEIHLFKVKSHIVGMALNCIALQKQL